MMVVNHNKYNDMNLVEIYENFIQDSNKLYKYKHSRDFYQFLKKYNFLIQHLIDVKLNITTPEAIFINNSHVYSPSGFRCIVELAVNQARRRLTLMNGIIREEKGD